MPSPSSAPALRAASPSFQPSALLSAQPSALPSAVLSNTTLATSSPSNLTPHCNIVIDGSPYHYNNAGLGSYVSTQLIPMYIWIVVAMLFGYETLVNSTNEKIRWLLISILTYTGFVYAIAMVITTYIAYTKSNSEVTAVVKGSRPCMDASGKKYT